MKKLIIIVMAIMLVFGAVGCQNSNPLTDPTNPMNPMNPNSPLNPNNPNNPFVDDFTSDEAYAAADAVVDGLDKQAILNKFLAEIKGGSASEPRQIQLGNELTVKYDFEDGRTEKKYNTTPAGLLELVGDYNSQLVSIIAKVLSSLGITVSENDVTNKTDFDTVDIRRIEAMCLDVNFNDMKDVYKTDYTISSISGTISLEILPLALDSNPAAITILINLSSDDLAVTMVDGSVYKIELDRFNTIFTNGNFYLPSSNDNSQSFTITYDGESETINWSKLAEDLDPLTAYYDGDIKEAAAAAYYNHFGHLRFLHRIHALLENETTDGNATILSNVFNANDTTGTLTLGLQFNDYEYYIDGSNQLVSGKATITFTGTYDDTSSKFTATAFTVSSKGALTLSDAADQIDDMSLPIENGTKGKMGTATSNNGIMFTIADDAASALTYYYNAGDNHAAEHDDAVTYDDEYHSFVVDLFS